MIILLLQWQLQEVLKAGQAFLAFWEDQADGPLLQSGAEQDLQS